jgi:hypothetical protein
VSQPSNQELVARAAYRIPPRSDISATQTVYLPTPVLRDVEKLAARMGQSVGWCIRMAWCIACNELDDGRAQLAARISRLSRGRKRSVAVELPLSTWHGVTLECERLDRSRSWLIARAWIIARKRFLTAIR